MAHSPTIVEGEYWPSVTEVANVLDKPHLRKWYGTHGWDACEKQKEESAERGRALHADVEKALQDYACGRSAAFSQWVDAAIRWCEITGFQPESFESHVKSAKYRYGGTYDCLGSMPHISAKVLVDWKFTGAVYDSNPLQGAGYAKAIEESSYAKVGEFRVIRFYELKREAKADKIKSRDKGVVRFNRYSFKGLKVFIEEAVYTDLDFYFQEFERCRGLWDYVNKKGAWAA
jgi:hypothetical protein